jgi:hypothetical protein
VRKLWMVRVTKGDKVRKGEKAMTVRGVQRGARIEPYEGFFQCFLTNWMSSTDDF